jgi:hypothetical protein
LPSKKAILSITNPCSENWEKMSDAACGKFCAACQKHVIDFTAMSDAELGRMINTTKGEICGRMTPEQMNRPIVLETYPSHWSARWVVALSALASFSGTLLAKPFNQLKNSSVFQNQEIVENIKKEKDNPRKLRFTLVDSMTYGFISSKVYIKELDLTAESDMNGYLEIALPKAFNGDTLTIEVNNNTYNAKSFHAEITEILKERHYVFFISKTIESYKYEMTDYSNFTGRICTSPIETEPFWQKLKNKFRRKNH